MIEATGRPEAGARPAITAIETGRPLALVYKRMDIAVGPGLSALARRVGKGMTPIDGDQSSSPIDHAPDLAQIWCMVGRLVDELGQDFLSRERAMNRAALRGEQHCRRPKIGEVLA